jgi:hypothetical protein
VKGEKNVDLFHVRRSLIAKEKTFYVLLLGSRLLGPNKVEKIAVWIYPLFLPLYLVRATLNLTAKHE